VTPGDIQLRPMEVSRHPGNSRIHQGVLENEEPKAIFSKLEKNACNILESDCCNKETNDNFSKR